jgi:hypothetical protein
MKMGVPVTTRIALIALGAGLSFLIPVFQSSEGMDRGTTWTGLVFILIAIILFGGARLWKTSAPEDESKP